MSELMIKTHDFEVAKKGLKEFSQKKAEELELNTVRTDGGFLGLGDHKVRGYELNSRLGIIQQHLIDLNNMNNRTIKEFGQVYSALEALDKDYIQAILISIKATEETSKRIKATQEHIKRIVDDQKKTLGVLKKFKQKLDNYAHLEDIDKMWSDYEKWHKDITKISYSINNATSVGNANAKKIEGLKAGLKTTDEKTADLEQRINQQIVEIESITAFTNDIDEMRESLTDAHNSLMNICNDLNSIKANASKQQLNIEILLKLMETLSGYEHLKDIDEIWSKTEAHSDRLDGLAQQGDYTLELVRANQIHIDELSEYKDELCGIAHLNEVDELWNSNEIHSSQISELEKQSEEVKNLILENKKLIDAAIIKAVEKNDTDVQMLTQKIKYAYLLAGGSLSLALIELIAILLKVI